ncbi:MAG: hypothetical protein ACRDYZ_09185 [Acidimicrobiales bacterium]
MDRIRSPAETPAVLAGSLAAFSLLDVLHLLATTGHVGELKVVSEGADDHFWVDAGDLIDTTGGATGRIFELSCAGDAWFTVTATLTARPPRAGARMSLSTVVEHLAPRLAEWRDLRASLPLDATARMASSTSRPEIHIRADQWRVLSLLGGGRRVGDVLDESDLTAVDTLRLLRELVDAGLVSIERTASEARIGGAGPRAGSAEAGSGGAEPRSGGAEPSPAGHGRRRGGTVFPDATDPSPRPAAGDPSPPSSLMPSPLVTRPWVSSGRYRRS